MTRPLTFFEYGSEHERGLCFSCSGWFRFREVHQYVKVILCQECFNRDENGFKLFEEKLIDLSILQKQEEDKEEELEVLDWEIKLKKRNLTALYQNWTSLYQKVEFRDKVLGIMNLLVGLLLSYTIFHGHRLNQDCWLCKYRGVSAMFLFSFIWGEEIIKNIWSAISDWLEDNHSQTSSEKSSEAESKSDDEEPKSDDPPKSEDPRVNFARNLEKKDEKK